MNWFKDLFKKKRVSQSEIPTSSPVPKDATQAPSVAWKHGVDLYHGDKFDIEKLKQESFVYIKATEGKGFIDSKFVERWKALGDAKIPRGAYHFHRGNIPPKDQAKLFCKVIFDLKPEDQLILDCETMDGASKSELKANLKIFLEEVEARTGKCCVIYGGSYFLKDLELDESFTKHKLWLADYRKQAEAKAPAPWKDWYIWQYTDKAADGGKLDRNWMKDV